MLCETPCMAALNVLLFLAQTMGKHKSCL